MPNVEISSETFEVIQAEAIPLIDTPESVIKRLIKELLRYREMHSMERSEFVEAISFSFKANKSFLTGNHAITIPAKYHRDLKRLGFIDEMLMSLSGKSETSIRINSVPTKKWAAYFYKGTTGGHDYYQIKSESRASADLGGNFAEREKLSAKITKEDGRPIVIIERIK